MSKLILAYCVENQFAASKIITALERKLEVEKVIFDADKGIKQLEKHIQNHTHPVLLLISDNFLKSEKCMNEALGIVQTLGNQKRLIPVTTDGVYVKEGNSNFTTIPTTFDRVSNVIQYMNHWQDYYLELRRAKPNTMDEGVFTEKVRVVRAISSEIGEMLRYLRAMEYFSFDQFEGSHFIILYRVLGIDVPPADLEHVKKFAVSHTTYPLERGIEKSAAEIVHTENGKSKHPSDNAIAEIDAPLDPEFDSLEKMDTLPFQIENLTKMDEQPKPEQKPPVSDAAFFETPDTLEALIEDIKNNTRYALDEEEKNSGKSSNIHQILDDVVNENDTKADEIGIKTALKVLDNIETIFNNDSIEEVKTNLESVDEPIAQHAPMVEIHNPIIAETPVETPATEPTIEPSLPVLEEPAVSVNTVNLLNTVQHDIFLGENEEEPMKPLHMQTKQNTIDFLTLAKEALAAQRFQEGIEHLESVIENDRTNVEAYMMMAYAAEQTKDYLLSLSCLEKVTLVQPHYPNIYYKLGTLINQHFKGQKRKAVRYFSDAIKFDATNADAYYQLAKLELENGGDFEVIILHLQEALKHNPDHADAAFELAKAYYEIGDKEQAASLYIRAWSVNEGYKTAINDAIFKYELPIPEPEPEPEPIIKPINDNGMVVLITGATSGIGRATAEIFAQHGFRLILTGRRGEKLEELKTQLEETHNNRNLLLNFDVRNPQAVKEAIENIEEDFKNVDILINNAGLASGLSPIHEGDINDWDVMIDTNIKGLLYMTRAIAPHMVARRKGHIINLCSIAGKEIYPNGNVYNASKHAVDALTRSMRVDLHKYNIRVSQVAPGAVEETEFALVRFHGDSEKAKIYEDFTPLKASDVAETIYFIASRPEYVNIQDVVMMCTQQASANHLDRSGRTDK